MRISKIHASEIVDSRGNPTVYCAVVLEDGAGGWASVPSGASTGSHEAIELRDNDPKRYQGKGVLHAVEHVNTSIAQALSGKDAADQRNIDNTLISLDGTENKSRLGANAILSVSLAVSRAEAVSEKKPLYRYLTKFNPDHDGVFVLPVPAMNIMNGGKHANWSTDIQEFMVYPLSASTFHDAVRIGVEVYQVLKKELADSGFLTLVGDEGGFAPTVGSNEEPFGLIKRAIEQAGYAAGTDIAFGIDAAASEFYSDGAYVLKKEGKTMSAGELGDFYRTLQEKYPIISLEDIFAEDDWAAFSDFTARDGGKTQIVGDDLYVTNVKRLEKGIAEKATSSILIKVNQIGTLSETIDAILAARKNGMSAIVSHRSGETEDPFIADLVVAMGTGQIKAGAPARSERTAKYNRLLRIEDELFGNCRYASFPLKGNVHAS
jgi:enolase